MEDTINECVHSLRPQVELRIGVRDAGTTKSLGTVAVPLGRVLAQTKEPRVRGVRIGAAAKLSMAKPPQSASEQCD